MIRTIEFSSGLSVSLIEVVKGKGQGEHGASWCVIYNTSKNPKPAKTTLRFTPEGEPYFNAAGMRMYLCDFERLSEQRNRSTKASATVS